MFFLWLSFLCFLSQRLIEKPCFPPKTAIFVHFLCFHLFLFSPFWPPPVSLSLSLSLSCPFLSSLLPVSHVDFWFLLFVIGLLVFCFKMFFCLLFFCLLCCFILNHNHRLVFTLHRILCCCCFFVFVAFIFCYFLSFGYPSKNISQKHGNRKTAKMKHAEKKRTFWQEQLAQVCSQVASFFLFCVSFHFAFFADHTRK